LEALVARWIWIVIVAAVVVVVVALIAGLAARRRRSAALRERFGPEYERTVQERDGRRSAEADLRNRQKQREQLTITPLPEPARLRYVQQWQELQTHFVDQPSSAVIEADDLVRQVMGAEGYPVDDFSAQAELVSVDHPRVVDNYRTAHDVYERTRANQASTEDMRRALLSYRSLFDELLAAGPEESSRWRPSTAGDSFFDHPPGER
jgi:hypothetical protein